MKAPIPPPISPAGIANITILVPRGVALVFDLAYATPAAVPSAAPIAI
jgi:hypothetical protein